MEMRNGKVASDINRKYSELMNAIYEHRKKGSIVIKIDVEPAKFDDTMTVVEVRQRAQEVQRLAMQFNPNE